MYLQSQAMAYQQERQQAQKMAMLQLELQAVEAGVTSLWEVYLEPGRNVRGYPMVAVVPGRDSDQASFAALQKHRAMWSARSAEYPDGTRSIIHDALQKFMLGNHRCCLDDVRHSGYEWREIGLRTRFIPVDGEVLFEDQFDRIRPGWLMPVVGPHTEYHF